ncbi:Mu transposase C-terminal domain-containing protein [Pseudorhodobacter aquimaris]|uniref:Mu transposase C-terminal domain-containing protein n=1 Tax=Pseudorhodobacter aquimaris TaxID=687412 RepID=UPI0012ED3559
MAPKAELLAELVCNVPWPAQGKPHSIHVDNGRDFRSHAFRSACAEWGIDLVYRPPGSPHFGGHIERLIGTMMGAVHLLPGTTQSSVVAKGDYDAEGMAAMTLGEFDRWFALEICRYNNSIHSSLGCTPVAKWEVLSEEMMGDIPFEMEAFRVSFLPSELRKVRRDGIHLFQIRYWSDALAGHIGRGDGKVVVRYDPRDLSMIWVELDDGRYVEARYRNLEIPPVPLWEYREAMRKARALGKSGSFEMEAFRVSFLPSELRKVRRDGIHLFQIRYWSDALAGHIGRGDGKVVVRYDPRDLSMIWVELDDGRYVEARYRNLEIPPVPLWEYREAMRKARALGKSGSNELVLAELIRQQRQIEFESRGLTKAERRSRERKGTLEGTNSAVSKTERLRPIDTGDTSRPLFKVERW